MNSNKNTQGIVESSIITGILVILGILGMYMPFFGIFLFIIPTPLIIIGQRQGVKYSVMSLIVATLIIIGFSNPIIALYIIGLPGMVAIAINIMIQKKAEASMIVLVGAITSVLTMILSINLADSLLGISLIENMKEIFKQSIEMQQYVGQMTNSNEDLLTQSKEMLENMEALALVLIPSIIIIASALTSLINYKLATVILKRTGNDVIELGPFKEFRLSKNASLGMIVIMFLSFITSKTNIVNGETLLVNVSLLFQIVFVAQGLAVAVFFYTHYRLSKILLILVIPLIFFSNMAVISLAIIGIVDIFMDLRKYARDTR
ncbi:MAG: DUF2232 domain-containing protein [Peptostreptococcales bacterium]|jgi:uncharacterized protein YybS (DUF2232 family)